MIDLPDMNMLELLLALLPGFLTAEIVGALVPREARSPLDRIIQALIYTFLSHLLWMPLSGLFGAAAPIQLLGLGICAVFWGLVLTWVTNRGVLHRGLRKIGLTKATSRPNEWYDAFYRREWHVILHLIDGRRVFGWPLLYSKGSESGHVLLTNAEWLDSSNKDVRTGRSDFLVAATYVRFVEFVPPTQKEITDA